MLGAARGVVCASPHTAARGATPHDLDDPVRVDAHDMVPALLQDSVVGAERAVHGTSAATPFHGILRAAGLEDCRCEVPSSKQQDQQHGHYQGAVRHMPFEALERGFISFARTDEDGNRQHIVHGKNARTTRGELSVGWRQADKR